MNGFRVWDVLKKRYTQGFDDNSGTFFINEEGQLVEVYVTEGGADFINYSDDKLCIPEFYSPFKDGDKFIICEGDKIRYKDKNGIVIMSSNSYHVWYYQLEGEQQRLPLQDINHTKIEIIGTIHD